MPTFTLHKFQEQAFLSKKRVTCLSAGIQSGKTTLGALWILDRATKCKPGDNLIIAAPTYKILQQATLPKFREYFKHFGKYSKMESTFLLKNGVMIYIRSMTDASSCEGITDVEGIWLDEGGLISRMAWENILGRSAFRQAPIMISTTPYALNWLFHMWEDWKAGKRDDVSFVQFTSKQNPYFPDEEFDRQQKLLDSRRFQMKYMGQFGKMEGLVYEQINIVKSFPLPTGTRYFCGIDWGYTNPTVLSIRALTPDGIHYRVGEYYKSGLTVDEIVAVCQQRKQLYNIELFIADPASPSYIESLNRGGCPCISGQNLVRVGIDMQITLIKQDRFMIFEDENPLGIDEYNTYHYAEPKEYKIDEDVKEPEPVKANDHGCFQAGTLVRTKRGSIPIEQVVVGDLVETPLGYSKVLWSGVTGRKQIFKFSFSDGSKVFATRDHKFYGYRKGFTPLAIDTIVYRWKSKNTSHLTEKPIHYAVILATILLHLGHRGLDYIEQFGSFIKNQYLMGMKFIISTLTPQTMLLETSNVSLNSSTTKDIRKEERKELGRMIESNIWQKLGNKQKSGMHPKMVENGTVSMQKRLLEKENRTSEPAYFVKKTFKPKALKPNIARTLVSLKLDAQMALITLKLIAKSANPFLKKTNIQKSEHVVLNAMEPTSQGRKHVYDLTVDCGCFYANDILVSNCDADRYVTMYLTKAEKKRPPQIDDRDQLERLRWLKRGGSSQYNR